MSKLMLTLVAGCMSAALAGAYAADLPTGAPETGPAPGAPTTKGARPAAKGAPPAAAPAPAPAAGAAAAPAAPMDDTKKGRRAARAEKG